uniref:protein CNPPD1 n=1 Tax=Myxine glutinosa TaxID=7769 RepID=UPI00358E0560
MCAGSTCSLEAFLSVEDSCCQSSLVHRQLSERLKKSLYYGWEESDKVEGLSCPVTDIAVEFFQNAAPAPVHKLQQKYAARVAREACVSPCAMVLALVYIERLKKRDPEYLRCISSSDLFLISMMMASKYLYDEGEEEEVFNDEWGAAGQIAVGDVNHLEMGFLQAMDWELFVHPQDFFSFLACLEASVTSREGRRRGWFMYSDLVILLGRPCLHHTLVQLSVLLSKVLCTCSLVYVSTFGALLGCATLIQLASVTRHSPTVTSQSPLSAGHHAWLPQPEAAVHNAVAPSSPLTDGGWPHEDHQSAGLHIATNDLCASAFTSSKQVSCLTNWHILRPEGADACRDHTWDASSKEHAHPSHDLSTTKAPGNNLTVCISCKGGCRAHLETHAKSVLIATQPLHGPFKSRPPLNYRYWQDFQCALKV